MTPHRLHAVPRRTAPGRTGDPSPGAVPRTSRRHTSGPGASGARGFTLIELIVVLALLGALLAIAAPRYVDVLDRGRERAQQANLQVLRSAIDAFHGDQGRYPDSLGELVERRYLRRLPVDPVTEAADWQVLPPPAGLPGRVWDVRGAAPSAAPASEAPGGREAEDRP